MNCWPHLVNIFSRPKTTSPMAREICKMGDPRKGGKGGSVGFWTSCGNGGSDARKWSHFVITKIDFLQGKESSSDAPFLCYAMWIPTAKRKRVGVLWVFYFIFSTQLWSCLLQIFSAPVPCLCFTHFCKPLALNKIHPTLHFLQNYWITQQLKILLPVSKIIYPFCY